MTESNQPLTTEGGGGGKRKKPRKGKKDTRGDDLAKRGCQPGRRERGEGRPCHEKQFANWS